VRDEPVTARPGARTGRTIHRPERGTSAPPVPATGPKRPAVPKRTLPSPGRSVRVAERVEGLRGRDRLVRSRLRLGVLEPGVVPGRSPRPPFRGPRRVVRRAVVQHRVGHIRAVAQEGPRPGRIHLRDPRVVTVSIPFSKSALDFFDK
jgi:hypothetical protein